MAIQQTTINITGNGQSDAIQLSPRENKVYVWYPVGVTGTLAPKTGITEARQIPFKVPDGDATLTEITGSLVFTVDGPGLLTFDVTSLSGGSIQVDAAEIL